MPPHAPDSRSCPSSDPIQSRTLVTASHKRGGKNFPGNEALLKLAASVTADNQDGVDAKLAKSSHIQTKARAPLKSRVNRRADAKAADSPRLRDAKARLVQQSHERQKEKRHKKIATRSLPSQSATPLPAPASNRKQVSFG
ncbi:hypothetical protein FRB93_000258 [Tulasnella sp. JGI-2019a]|nr:hypothetical protein FRB93_000258 [Tulasnella sp. JGI-2019a]